MFTMRKVTKITLRCFVCLLLVVICLSLFGCQSNIEANRQRHINSINHRGYKDAPENTLSAFRLSKEMGFDMVECDVSFTKDNVPVLLHDGSVNRTSNGTGKISNLTLDEVRQFDFGSWKNTRYAGETIPTFQEFLDLCIELDLYPYIEIKNGASLQHARQLVEMVDKTDLSVTWLARDRNILQLIAELRSGDRIGLVTAFIIRDDLKFLSNLSKTVEVFVDCNYFTLTSKQILNCKLYKIPLEVWTLNSQAIIENIDPYITGVTSDYLIAQDIFNNM